MSIEEIPASGWMWFVIVGIVIMQTYNTYCTARRNAREEKKLSEKPTDGINQRLNDHAKMLDNDKRRLDDHEAQLADIKKGLMANCAGVQALLEHELHNGNATDMESASKDISTWLRTRP